MYARHHSSSIMKGAVISWKGNIVKGAEMTLIADLVLMLQAQGRQPHEEVRRFYARHYSSNIMKGAVMGRQSLAELEALVRAKFDAVANADLQPAEFDGEHPKMLIVCPFSRIAPI